MGIVNNMDGDGGPRMIGLRMKCTAKNDGSDNVRHRQLASPTYCSWIMGPQMIVQWMIGIDGTYVVTMTLPMMGRKTIRARDKGVTYYKVAGGGYY